MSEIDELDRLWELNEAAARNEEATDLAEKEPRSPAVRLRDKLRKRRERENTRAQSLQLQKDREAAEQTKRQQVQCEQSGLLALFEVRPGIQAETLQEQYAIAVQRGRKYIGPTPRIVQETYRQYFLRLTDSWARHLCPMFDAQNGRMIPGSIEQLYERAGLDRQTYSVGTAVEAVKNYWRENPGENTRPELDELITEEARDVQVPDLRS